MHNFKLLIGGELVAGADGLKVINPATGRPFARSPRADAAQLEAAVGAAKAAFPGWASTPIDERRSALLAMAGALMARQDEFAKLLTAEQGRPLPGAHFEIAGSAYLLQYYSSLELADSVLRDSEAEIVVKQYVPLGVVAAIMPWNFPLLLLVTKLAPALLAGNTVVAKPAPTTPLTTLLFGELSREFLPPGVLNIIVDAHDLGERLTGHPDVAKVAFTGSTATGLKVGGAAGASLKRMTLELGGNDAAIVLDDADPATVAPLIFAGAMMNSGQLCVATKRVYVHESQYDAFCETLAACAAHAVVDDGMVEGAQLGPVQNLAQYRRIIELIEDAAREGKIIAGGAAIDRDGYFIAPTIVRDLSEDARLVREEQFGPVLPVLRYSDVDDAIARANDGDYGLGATIWSGDIERAQGVAQRIESGLVCINRNPELQPDIPLGGFKKSGIGAELGREGLEEFTQSRIVSLARQQPGA